MNKIIPFLMTLTTINFYATEVAAQNISKFEETKTQGNTITNTGGTSGTRVWTINRVLEQKNVSNISMQIEAGFGFFAGQALSTSMLTSMTGFEINFFGEKYRNNSCISTKNNQGKIVKIVINDTETINPEQPDFTELTIINEDEKANKIVKDTFSFNLSFAETKKIANAQTVKYQLCDDNYQLSASAIKELQYLVAKTEEAANKYNYDLYQQPETNIFEIPQINVPGFQF